MSRSPLGQHLSGRSQTDNGNGQSWDQLFRKALRLANRYDDPRAELLSNHTHDKKRILKTLSLVSEDDLNREFGNG